MILLCDENISPLIVNEVNLLGYTARSFRDLGWLGASEDRWMPLAAQMTDTLILTYDLNIFRRDQQRPRIVNNNVGVVFLTGANETFDSKISLITSSLPALEKLHSNTSKPFAWFLYPDGRLLDNLDGERL